MNRTKPVPMVSIVDSKSTKLKVTTTKEGDGVQPAQGQIVVVHYTGTLEDGTKFDSSFDRNQPFSFPVGQGKVIKGWDEGIPGMRVGGKRKLIIPPSMGYGNQNMGAIPPNSTLIFEVDLLGIE